MHFHAVHSDVDAETGKNIRTLSCPPMVVAEFSVFEANCTRFDESEEVVMLAWRGLRTECCRGNDCCITMESLVMESLLLRWDSVAKGCTARMYCARDRRWCEEAKRRCGICSHGRTINQDEGTRANVKHLEFISSFPFTFEHNPISCKMVSVKVVRSPSSTLTAQA